MLNCVNSTMPYRSFHSQNRVEYIKKKFESSLSEESKSAPLKNVDVTACPKSKVLLELKDINTNKSNSKETSHSKFEIFEKPDVNKIDGKALVKRTPAFRREKMGSSKSLGKASFQKSVNTVVDLNKSSPLVSMKKETEDLQALSNNNVCCGGHSENEIQRSKTDSNLLRDCDIRNNTKVNYIKSTLVSKKIDLLEESQNKNVQSDMDGKALAQYSIINKNLVTGNGGGKNELKLSESIRRALLSPLPKGPPPKKPPRTFCHNLHNYNKDSSTSSKMDIPKLKSKLEKLERVVKIHEKGNNFAVATDEFKADLEKKLNKNPMTIEKSSLINASHKKIESQSCLQFSNCLNQCVNPNVYEKLLEKKSEFYFNLNKSESELQEHDSIDINKTVINGTDCETLPVRNSTSEPIYDLPCVNKKNLRTFGKSDKENISSLKTKKVEESLHYMSADVVNNLSFHFLPNLEQERFLESNDGTAGVEPRAEILPGTRGKVPTIVGKFEKDKEQVDKVMDELRTTKGNEGGKNSSTVHQSSTESDSDSLSTYSAPEDFGSPLLFEREKDLSVSESGNISKALKGETLTQMTANRKIYLSKVSSKISRVPYWKNVNKNRNTRLFECCLLVGLTLCESKQKVPYIKTIFPPHVKPPPLIEFLCFPDASDWPPSSENQLPEEQYYSLVVTNESGDRKFGYCRRVLPEGGHFCLPLTYCIVSPHRANGFFYKVLQELESRHGSPGMESFIERLYECRFPGPGERLKLVEILEEAARTKPVDYASSTLVRRPCDVRLEEKDLTQLLEVLHLPVFLKVFSSLLHERKVLLLSNSLRKLSLCIEALQSILLPFSWQHTYIPVLPVHLIEMCEAPTPYVIGLLKPKNVDKSFVALNFEDGIAVDLDDSKIIQCCGDEGTILPPKFVKDLTTSLNLAASAADLTDSLRNVLISDAFIRFFVQVCGNYSKFVVDSVEGHKTFEKEEFIKSARSRTTMSFLEWFTETAMFNVFIHERLQGDVEDVQVKLFRLRATEYSDAVKNSKIHVNRKVRTLGDKIKDFTSFNK